jgi:lipopolysaccharide biosynthesis regulator YciM
MKHRTIAVVALIVFLLLVFAAISKTGIRLLDSRFFQIDSTLFFIIAFSVALGASVVFLLLSIFPLRLPDSLKIGSVQSSGERHMSDSSTIRRAEIAIQLGEFERGIELLQEVPQNSADYWFARKLAGDISFEGSDWERAEREYQVSLKYASEEEKPLALFALANLYNHQDLPDRAEDLYRQVLQFQPIAAEAAIRLRLLAIQQEDWEKALSIQEYIEQQLPELFTDSDEQKLQLGIRYSLAEAEYRRGAFKTALALLKHVMDITDQFVPAYLLYGEALEKLNQSSTALKMWERGFRATSNPALLQRIGEYYLAQNLPEKAIDFYIKTIGTHTQNPEFAFCLGDLYLKMEMNREALRVFQKVEEQFPDWPLNRFMMAQLYQREGHSDQAADMYHALIERGQLMDVFPWICDICGTPSNEYRSFCSECGEWNSVGIKQAGRMITSHAKSTAFLF